MQKKRRLAPGFREVVQKRAKLHVYAHWEAEVGAVDDVRRRHRRGRAQDVALDLCWVQLNYLTISNYLTLKGSFSAGWLAGWLVNRTVLKN